MMGEQLGLQDRLFYEFCLDDVVPNDHLLRKIDAVLDISWLRGELAPFYSHTGRPSVCPELMIRMLIVGYCYSIRSERRLCAGEARPATGPRGVAERAEPCLSMVLQARSRGPDSRSLELLGQSPWSLPRERCLANGIRRGRMQLHEGGARRRRRLCRGRQRDRG